VTDVRRTTRTTPGTTLSVTRLDAECGWGQDLVLRANVVGDSTSAEYHLVVSDAYKTAAHAVTTFVTLAEREGVDVRAAVSPVPAAVVVKNDVKRGLEGLLSRGLSFIGNAVAKSDVGEVVSSAVATTVVDAVGTITGVVNNADVRRAVRDSQRFLESLAEMERIEPEATTPPSSASAGWSAHDDIAAGVGGAAAAAVSASTAAAADDAGSDAGATAVAVAASDDDRDSDLQSALLESLDSMSIQGADGEKGPSGSAGPAASGHDEKQHHVGYV
jgi:hypothetical protein